MEEKPTCSFCGKDIDKDTLRVQGIGDVTICQACAQKVYSALNAADTWIDNNKKEKAAENPQKISLPHPAEIKKHLDEYIEGQDYAKRVLSVAVYNHYKMLQIKAKQKKDKDKKDLTELEKGNILILGPTGSGKTAILRHLAKILKVPFTMTDSTMYSSAGYVGRDVECIIKDLISAANGNVKAAERGIVYIDEIDKTSRKGENLSTTADPGHEGVQQALLKLLEGTTIEVPESGRRIHPEARTITVNTENILFIVGGSFEGIEKIIAKRLRSSNGNGLMGFGSQLVDKKNENFNEFIEQVTVEDLKKFGMLPEILGRLPIIAPMKELTEEQLMNILHKPKNALVKQYKELFAHDEIDFSMTNQALRAVAKKAIKRKTGARGLRGIMEDILNPIMFDMPDREEDKIILDAENEEVKIKYEKRKKKEAV